MKIQTQLSDNTRVLTITLPGKFDYTCHQDFQTVYENVRPVPNNFIIDSLEVTPIDSSALGMLLLPRNHAGGNDADIINARPGIHELLRTCKFDELFVIEALN